jgi:hypothetical protein
MSACWIIDGEQSAYKETCMNPGDSNAMPLVFGEGNGPRNEYPKVYERNVNIQIIDGFPLRYG